MEAFETFKQKIAETFTDVSPVINIDDDVKTVETSFYPSIVKILSKDESFFAEDRVLMGVNLSDLWKQDKLPKDDFWKSLQMCCIASFMHGDIKDKIPSLISAAKSYFLKTGQEDSEISKLLADDKSEDNIKEIIDYVMKTRLAKIFMSIVEQIDLTELDLNFEKPEDLMEIIQNPEHPKIKKIIDKIQNLIKTKLQRGEITKNQIAEEVEGVKAKITSMFGNMFNDALGGRGETPSTVLMGNSPEARRQRMLARLQKKQREKNSL
jgi:hypothetical protein